MKLERSRTDSLPQLTPNASLLFAAFLCLAVPVRGDFIDSFAVGPQDLSLGPGQSHGADSVTSLDPLQVAWGGRYLSMVADADSGFRSLEVGFVSATVSGLSPGSLSIQAAIPYVEHVSSYEPALNLSYSGLSADWSAFDRITIRFSTPPTTNVAVQTSVYSAGNASWVDTVVPADTLSVTILFAELTGLTPANVTELSFQWSLPQQVSLVLRDIQVTGSGGAEVPRLNLVLVAGAVLSWPTNAVGFRLESSPSLTAPFSTVTNAPFVVGTNYTVTLPADQPAQYFRLSKP